MGRRAWAINSRLSFSDLVHDEKRQDASIPVTTSIAIEKFAETVSCQAEVHDVEKKKDSGYRSSKLELELPARDWLAAKSLAWLGLAWRLPFPRHHELRHFRNQPAINLLHNTQAASITGHNDVSTGATAVSPTMYSFSDPRAVTDPS